MGSRQGWASGGVAIGFLSVVLLVQPVHTSRDIHAEYIKYASGADSITAYIAYPERRESGPGLLVIHEIFGLSDFVRDAAERLAREGFVVLAPDLLSRFGGTPASPDSARRLIASLKREVITQDLDAGFAYLKGLKAVQDTHIGVIGFCWGGGEAFPYAVHNRGLAAFVVCYGPTPKASEIDYMKVPGFGVYADKDIRVNQGLSDFSGALTQYHVEFKFKIYPGVGHGFLRTREDPKIADQAWGDVIRFLRGRLGGGPKTGK
jgi:carboxymethylenebutenolidase